MDGEPKKLGRLAVRQGDREFPALNLWSAPPIFSAPPLDGIFFPLIGLFINNDMLNVLCLTIPICPTCADAENSYCELENSLRFRILGNW